MATARLILDRRRMRKDGTYAVRIAVRHHGSFLVTTGLTATDVTWRDGSYTAKAPNAKARNAAAHRMLASVETLILRLGTEGRLRLMDDEALKKAIRAEIGDDGEVARRTFVSYLDEFVSMKDREGTRANYLTTRNKILAFDPRCTLETIDRKWLGRFEAWMAGTMRVNSYAMHLRNVRAVFNYCIDEGYTSAYPFRKFHIKSERTRKRSLTVEALRKLRDWPCEAYQVKYRDMFMLMFYLIGINAADLFMARPGDLRDGRLEYRRAKTGRLYSIKVEREAMEIIDRYRGKDYLLNVMDTHVDYRYFLYRMNDGLKAIGTMRREGKGGRKARSPLFPDISSYWARHTWATVAASLDIPSDTISEALGHEHGSGVTAVYIRYDQRKVDEANRRVIDLVNGDG